MAILVVKRRALILLLSLVSSAAGCEWTRTTELPEEDRLLEELMEQYVTERFRFYPVESTLAGLPGNDDRLGDYARADFEKRIAWLADFHQRLFGLRLTALSEPAYVDAMWLSSLVKAELFELEKRRTWQRTASFYGETLRVGLVSLLADAELSEKADALAGRLSEIPPLLAHARENLVPSSGAFRSDGMRSLELCRRLLADLPAMLEGRLEPFRIVELADRSRLAARAVQELLASISRNEAEPSADATPLGAEDLKRFWFNREMVEWSPAEIEERAREELETFTDRMTELALSYFPGSPLQELLAGREEAEAADSPESIVAAMEARVRAFLRERGESPLHGPVPVRRAPFFFTAPERARLWRPAALEPARSAFLMVSPASESRGALGLDALELLTLREVAGRYRQYRHQAESTSLLRRVFAAETTSEGWLLYFESRLLSEGFDPDNHWLRLEHLHRTLVELTRLLAVVEFHANGKSLSDLVRLFRERAFLTTELSTVEAERAIVEPGVGSAALGRLLVEALARDFFRRFPLATPSELNERLLSEGLLPVRLARFTLLPASPLARLPAEPRR